MVEILSDSLGKVFSWGALGLFVLSFCLANRSLAWNSRILNWETSLKWHHRLAWCGVVFLWAHVLFEATELWDGFWSSTVALQVEEPGLLAAWTALGLLLFVLWGAYQDRWSGRRWRWVHRLSGISWLLIALHVFLFSEEGVAFYVNMGLLVVGSVALLRAIYGPRSSSWGVGAEVLQAGLKAPQILDLWVRPLSEEKWAPQPGQFYYLRFEGLGQRSWHPFSCAGLGAGGRLRFVIKLRGEDTRALEQLKPGNRVRVDGPYGRLHVSTSGHELWVVGGVGITPFLSWAAHPNFASTQTTLLYCVKNAQEAVFLEELEALQKQTPNFRVYLWNTEARGFLDITGLKSVLSSGAVDLYLAGPAAFVKHVRRLARGLGVHPRFLHSEEGVR